MIFLPVVQRPWRIGPGSVRDAVALVPALASTTLTNLAYLREHDAAAELPGSVHAPLHSARLQLEDRSWMLGFAVESSSLLLYAAALALAPLALVQSIAAGGIGILAFASAWLARRRLSSYELMGVLISVFDLVALGLLLAAGGGKDARGSTTSILLWLGATATVAIVLVLLGRKVIGVAVADGMAPRRSSRSATSRRSWPPRAAFVSASW